MKFLHTSDWHVGKTLKGRSRLDEQEAVLTARSSASPSSISPTPSSSPATCTTPPPRSADAQRILIKTLLALAGTGAQVIAMAGNHDSRRYARRIPAARWVRRHHAASDQPRAADRGGVVSFTARAPAKQSMSLSCRSCPSAGRSAPPTCSLQPPPKLPAATTSRSGNCSPTSKPGSPPAR